MPQQQIEGYDRAVELVNKRMSPRAQRLAGLELWVEGRQYDGKRPWDEDCPIAEKAPCIVEPIVADAIESHVDMVLGEGRFPAITTRPAEDEDDDPSGKDESPDDAEDDEGGLNEQDSAILDRLLAGIAEQSRFPTLCREALSLALGCGTSCAIYGAREGRLFGDTVRARWCQPEFMPDARTVQRLVIEYPYIDTYQDKDGRWHARARVYRREIDAQKDVTMLPAEADVATPKWVANADMVFEHGLGFCPVVWYPFMRGCSIVGQIDGHAPHENLTDEIYAHDVALSQRHRAALYAGDPQWTEIGVELGHNPSGSGKVVPIPATANGGPATADNPVIGSYNGEPSQQGNGRKKHPGTVWQYEGENVKVELHTLPPDALKSITDHAHDVRSKLLQALAYVPLDTENSAIVRGLTGKAIELLKQRQTNRDDKIRDDFGDGFLKPSLCMLLRIAHAKSDALRTRGLKRATPILARFAGSDEAPSAVA
jgi:hypothetical protein